MPDELLNLINAQAVPLWQFKMEMYDAYQYLYNAGSLLKTEYFADAGDALMVSAGYFYDAALCIAGGADNFRIDTARVLKWINNNWPADGDPYVLTMAKLLDAIWESEPLETFFFVNDIDAMRASIWNIKIEETRLHELYRHFSL